MAFERLRFVDGYYLGEDGKINFSRANHIIDPIMMGYDTPTVEDQVQKFVDSHRAGVFVLASQFNDMTHFLVTDGEVEIMPKKPEMHNRWLACVREPFLFAGDGCDMNIVSMAARYNGAFYNLMVERKSSRNPDGESGYGRLHIGTVHAGELKQPNGAYRNLTQLDQWSYVSDRTDVRRATVTGFSGEWGLIPHKTNYDVGCRMGFSNEEDFLMYEMMS